jgi:hypothetical protein
MYKQASRFRQGLAQGGNRDTGGRNLVMSDSFKPAPGAKTVLTRKLDKEAGRANQAPQRDGGVRLVKRSKQSDRSN